MNQKKKWIHQTRQKLVKLIEHIKTFQANEHELKARARLTWSERPAVEEGKHPAPT